VYGPKFHYKTDLIKKDFDEWITRDSATFMIMPEGCWPASRLLNPKLPQVLHPAFIPLFGTLTRDYEQKHKKRQLKLMALHGTAELEHRPSGKRLEVTTGQATLLLKVADGGQTLESLRRFVQWESNVVEVMLKPMLSSGVVILEGDSLRVGEKSQIEKAQSILVTMEDLVSHSQSQTQSTIQAQSPL
jgi:hypothetical protein